MPIDPWSIYLRLVLAYATPIALVWLTLAPRRKVEDNGSDGKTDSDAASDEESRR